MRKPRDTLEKLLGDMDIPSDLETYIPDVVGGTLFLYRERPEPFACTFWSEYGGVEEVTLAGLNP